MNCPKCGKEMINGYIPDHGKSLIFIAPKKSNLDYDTYEDTSIQFGIFGASITLTKYPIFKGYNKAESFYCSRCKFVITPVKE